jgi:hypothetical protein
VRPTPKARVLSGRTIGGGRVRALDGLPDMYPGTKKEKAGEMRGETHMRGGRSASFPLCIVVSAPTPLSQPALEVTEDLDKEERRAGRSGNDLGVGPTGCGGGIDERLREEDFFCQPLTSYLRQDRSNAGGRLSCKVRDQVNFVDVDGNDILQRRY